MAGQSEAYVDHNWDLQLASKGGESFGTETLTCRVQLWLELYSIRMHAQDTQLGELEN